LVIVAVVLFGAGDNCASTSSPVSAPSAETATAGQMVSYFESQGIPPTAAAGIVGNLQQESGLNPTSAGYGLAQWGGGWWTSAAAWITSHGQEPSTAAGQLLYIAANVEDGIDERYFYPGLKDQLDAASSPQQAALVWMDDYEQCSGAGPRGTTMFVDGSLCDAENRENYAIEALAAAAGAGRAGTGGAVAVPVSFVTGTACAAVAAGPGGYANPFAQATGISWERTDQGVDAAMNVGSPLLAFAPSRYVQQVPDFYAGEPAMIFKVLAGPEAGDYWYWSEQITPTISVGATVQTGQQVAVYAPSGTAIEIGWWAIDAGRPLGGVEGYSEGYSTLSGADFRDMLQQLGANPGSGAGFSIPHPLTIGNQDYPPPPY